MNAKNKSRRKQMCTRKKVRSNDRNMPVTEAREMQTEAYLGMHRSE